VINLFNAIQFRLIHGRWCTHPKWMPWRKRDEGQFTHRVCLHCGRREAA
jgi:hypothetical protein